MNCNFDLKSSILYDQLSFPTLLFNDPNWNKESSYDIALFKSGETYISLLKDIRSSLTPYEEDIKYFFSTNQTPMSDLIDIIIDAYPLTGFNSLEEYFDHLMNTNNTDLIKKCVFAVNNLTEEDIDYNDCDNDIDFIQKINLEQRLKWLLLLFFQNPKKELEKLKDLYKKLLPYHNQYYSDQEVQMVGQYVEQQINSMDPEKHKALTHGIYDLSVLTETNITIYVSYWHMFSLIVSKNQNDTTLIWGIKLQEAFSEIDRLGKDKINKVTKLFKSLSDPNKFRILKLISSGETKIKEIARIIGVSSATVSYHISDLFTMGIIKFKAQTKSLGYQINKEALDEAWDFIMTELNVEDKSN